MDCGSHNSPNTYSQMSQSPTQLRPMLMANNRETGQTHSVNLDPVVRSGQVQQRSRGACDACRARKVKCDSNGPSCTICIELRVPCTRNKPRKRRGPQNRYVLALAEAAATQEDFPSPPTTSESAPTPVATPVDSQTILDEIAPSEIIRNIVDDWFELIHAICPIHHHANFLTRLENGDIARDPIFLAVLISLCAATIASLPRRRATRYGNVTVQQCHNAIERNHLLDEDRNITLQWCQAKYHLSTSLLPVQGTDSAYSFRLLGEATAGIQYLTFYNFTLQSQVEQELTKRLHWLIFYGQCTLNMYNRPSIGLLSPRHRLQNLYPLDLNDTKLDPTNINPSRPWHGDTMSYTPGHEFQIRLFLLWHFSQQLCPPTQAHLQHHMSLVQRALDDLPPNLRWRGGLSRPPDSNFGTDVQTVNLYITQLHIRSCLLEQMHNISLSQTTTDASIMQSGVGLGGGVGGGGVGGEQVGTGIGSGTICFGLDEIRKERSSIVEDLLEIIYHVSEETLEANGHSLMPKIRDIGSVLLDEIRMGNGQLAGGDQGSHQNTNSDLRRLLEKLERLDIRP